MGTITDTKRCAVCALPLPPLKVGDRPYFCEDHGFRFCSPHCQEWHGYHGEED